MFDSKILNALVRLEVPLDVLVISIVIDEFQCVRRVAIHVAVTIRGTTVGKEDGNLVNGLGNERDEVPKHVRVAGVRLRVTLLCVDEVGELDGIANEEDRRVVANHVPVALFGVKLDSKAAWVSGRYSVRNQY